MSDQLGERLLLANDQIRVWEDRVPVGGAQALHTHTRPYLSVVIRGALGETVDAEGRRLTSVVREPGDVRFFGPEAVPITHSLRNSGNEEIRVVIVELLEAPVPAEPT